MVSKTIKESIIQMGFRGPNRMFETPIRIKSILTKHILLQGNELRSIYERAIRSWRRIGKNYG